MVTNAVRIVLLLAFLGLLYLIAQHVGAAVIDTGTRAVARLK